MIWNFLATFRINVFNFWRCVKNNSLCFYLDYLDRAITYLANALYTISLDYIIFQLKFYDYILKSCRLADNIISSLHDDFTFLLNDKSL